MQEVWKDIPEYKGLYQVSNLGRVKSLSRYVDIQSENKRYKIPAKILAQGKGRYLNVALCFRHKRKTISVHRLVAQAFIPNPDNLPEVDHIDGNPENNRANNLRWCTHKENSNNPITLKRMKDNCTANKRFSGSSPVSRMIVRISRKGDRKIYNSIMDAKRDGFCYQSIMLCLKGKMKQHKSFKWEYIKDPISNL